MAALSEAEVSSSARIALKRRLSTAVAGSELKFSDYHVDLAIDVLGTTEFDSIYSWLAANRELTFDEQKDECLIGVSDFFNTTPEKAYYICHEREWNYESVIMFGMELMGKDDESIDTKWAALSSSDREKYQMDCFMLRATISSLRDQRRREHTEFTSYNYKHTHTLTHIVSRKFHFFALFLLLCIEAISSTLAAAASTGLPPPPPPPPLVPPPAPPLIPSAPLASSGIFVNRRVKSKPFLLIFAIVYRY